MPLEWMEKHPERVSGMQSVGGRWIKWGGGAGVLESVEYVGESGRILIYPYGYPFSGREEWFQTNASTLARCRGISLCTREETATLTALEAPSCIVEPMRGLLCSHAQDGIQGTARVRTHNAQARPRSPHPPLAEAGLPGHYSSGTPCQSISYPSSLVSVHISARAENFSLNVASAWLASCWPKLFQ